MNLARSLLIALSLSVLTYPRHSSLMKVKFTNIACENHDAEFSTFKRCELKALSRDTVSLHAHLQIHKLPISSGTVNAAFFVKGNGYRPYLYNNTLDVCKFLKNPNHQQFWKLFYDMTKGVTNVNHSCPYNHDLIVDGLTLNANMFRLIPFPSNYYMVRASGSFDNRVRGEIRIYFQIYD